MIKKGKNAYILIAFLAVIIRIAIVSYLYRNGTDTFGTDGLLYHQEGIKVAQQLSIGISVFSVQYSYTWYTVFIGIVYHLLGVSRYIISYINIAFTFFSALLLLKIALNHKYHFFNAAFISLAFLYFPNLLLWTADSRKEALLIFICFLCWHSVQSFITGLEKENRITVKSITQIVFVCFLIWFCTIVRIYMFAPLAAGVIISQLMLYKKSRAKLSFAFALVVFVFTFVIFFATVNPLMQDYHAVRFSDEQSDNLLDDVNSKFSTVKSIASSRNIIVSIVNYILLPYPGNLDIDDIAGNKKIEWIVSMDIIVWYVCLLLMLTGIYSTLRQKDSCFIGILTYLGSYVFINALVVENVADTIYRYRSVILGLSLLFIDWGVLKKLVEHSNSRLRLKAGASKTHTTGGYGIKH